MKVHKNIWSLSVVGTSTSSKLLYSDTYVPGEETIPTGQVSLKDFDAMGPRQASEGYTVPLESLLPKRPGNEGTFSSILKWLSE